MATIHTFDSGKEWQIVGAKRAEGACYGPNIALVMVLESMITALFGEVRLLELAALNPEIYFLTRNRLRFDDLSTHIFGGLVKALALIKMALKSPDDVNLSP